MAGIARVRDITIFNFRFMAIFTLCFSISMRAFQIKIRLCMLERFFIDWRYLCRTPFMFSVAFSAITRLFQLAMKSFFLRNVFIDLFMAILTKLVLPFLIEAFVAFLAAIFPLKMSLNHLARHHHGLKRISTCAK